MRDFSADDDYDDLCELGIPFSEEEASRLTCHQLDTEALLKRCENELQATFKANERAVHNRDIIGIMTEHNRMYLLQGYNRGLARLAAVLRDLTEGENVGDDAFTFSEDQREVIRQEAIRDFVYINDKILERLDAKTDKPNPGN